MDIEMKNSFHTPRELIGTYLLESGVSLELIQELLGHADLKLHSFFIQM